MVSWGSLHNVYIHDIYIASLSRMTLLHVRFERNIVIEPLFTNETFVRFFHGVRSHMNRQIVICSEGFSTGHTFKQLLILVNSHVAM